MCRVSISGSAAQNEVLGIPTVVGKSGSTIRIYLLIVKIFLVVSIRICYHICKRQTPRRKNTKTNTVFFFLCKRVCLVYRNSQEQSSNAHAPSWRFAEHQRCLLAADGDHVVMAVVFPYDPILRSTTTVDDTRPLPVPETERNRIFIQATVPPVRTVVLDSHGQISEIWSNTAGNVYHYTLYVRRGDRDGPLVDYSPTVHTQYAMLIPLVDWRPSGRVYPTVESSKNSVVSASPIRRLSFRE